MLPEIKSNREKVRTWMNFPSFKLFSFPLHFRVIRDIFISRPARQLLLLTCHYNCNRRVRESVRSYLQKVVGSSLTQLPSAKLSKLYKFSHYRNSPISSKEQTSQPLHCSCNSIISYNVVDYHSYLDYALN